MQGTQTRDLRRQGRVVGPLTTRCFASSQDLREWLASKDDLSSHKQQVGALINSILHTRTGDRQMYKSEGVRRNRPYDEPTDLFQASFVALSPNPESRCTKHCPYCHEMFTVSVHKISCPDCGGRFSSP